MDGLKILVAGEGPMTELSLRHFREFFAAKEIPLDILKLAVNHPSELEAAVREAGAARAVRVEADLSVEWVLTRSVQPLSVSRFGAADLFICRDGKWEPELVLERALHDVIVKQGKTLDLSGSAYVVGQRVSLRVVAGVCLGLGFRRIYLVGEDESDIIDQREHLQQLYLGTDIVALPAHSLTLQTVGASLLVNTLDLLEKPEIASDLAYFNFMQTAGLVVDLMAKRMDNVVLEEALRAGLRILPPHEVSGAADLKLAAHLGLGALAPEREFLNSWFEFLRGESENQPSV